MGNAMKHWLFAITLAIGLAGPAWAGLDEGLAAFESGDYEAAKWEFMSLAKQGDPVAQFYLGVIYREKNVGIAANWFKKAAQRGHSEAQFALAQLYETGMGVPQDRIEARRWYKAAAEQGHTESQARVNVLNREISLEEWIEHDMRGFPIVREALDAELRQLYLELYKRAVDNEEAAAQFELGAIYEGGKEIPRNYAAAMRWYHISALNGFAEAQYRFALLLSSTAIDSDKEFAWAWFEIAAQQGHMRAVVARDNLGQTMDDADRLLAQARLKTVKRMIELEERRQEEYEGWRGGDAVMRCVHHGKVFIVEIERKEARISVDGARAHPLEVTFVPYGFVMTAGTSNEGVTYIANLEERNLSFFTFGPGFNFGSRETARCKDIR